ncbi:probable purine permease 11 [Dioscorea cayenensis subsp. rotundata]|uniref:Probable purine permease n=1 Tax=Dioscorea cayennensis subsp. rotundata TaxID=55577 RepID=A0AB40B176_DIOCR|nr:probable purine permease 11 [Dioscorea cayenensis subsp. rotundata]
MAHHDHIQEVQLQIQGGANDHQEQPCNNHNNNNKEPSPKHTFKFKINHWKWWLTVLLNIIFILSGQTSSTLLGRLYFDKGGKSLWMSTLVQSVGFPVLIIYIFIYNITTTYNKKHPLIISSSTAFPSIIFIYIMLGIIIAGDNLMYSYGLLYLPVSTYSLICASQLAFNALFSYFINSQKLTPFIFNSVILLTFSAALLGVRSDSGEASEYNKYPLGFVLTVGASATYSLILSLIQLTFQKVLKKESFTIVVELQICTSVVASLVSVIGLLASGEWRGLKEEMEGFEEGKVAYVMVLVWIGIGWQVAAVGLIGLVFVVSSLFSNMISTLSLPLVPIFAVIFFHDRMDGVKIMAMLIAVWGFLSYIYQHYLDDLETKNKKQPCSSFSSSNDGDNGSDVIHDRVV